MKKLTIGLIAATPIDTQFGVEFLKRRNVKSFAAFVSRNPMAQTILQTQNPKLLQKKCLNIFLKFQKQGVDIILIYCNSMVSALNLEIIKKTVGIPVVTVEDVYRHLAKKYKSFSILAANSVGACGAEKYLLRYNPCLRNISAGHLTLVEEIEKEAPAEKIIQRTGLGNFLDYSEQNKREVLLLACTHFHCLLAPLQKLVAQRGYKIRIVDLDEEFGRIIQEANIRQKPIF